MDPMTPATARTIADELEAHHHADMPLAVRAEVDADTVALVPPAGWEYAALARGECVMLGRREGRVTWTVVARHGRLVWGGPVEHDRG